MHAAKSKNIIHNKVSGKTDTAKPKKATHPTHLIDAKSESGFGIVLVRVEGGNPAEVL